MARTRNDLPWTAPAVPNIQDMMFGAAVTNPFENYLRTLQPVTSAEKLINNVSAMTELSPAYKSLLRQPASVFDQSLLTSQLPRADVWDMFRKPMLGVEQLTQLQDMFRGTSALSEQIAAVSDALAVAIVVDEAHEYEPSSADAYRALPVATKARVFIYLVAFVCFVLTSVAHESGSQLPDQHVMEVIVQIGEALGFYDCARAALTSGAG